MIRRRTAAIVAAVVLATACTGADDAAPTTTAETDEPDDALVTIPPAAQESTTTAPTSPDGAQLAVFEFYRGDDSTVTDSEASGRVSIAPVESLSRGEAAWSTITGIGPGTPSNDLDRDVTTITWPTADRIHVELLDRLIAVAVGDA